MYAYDDITETCSPRSALQKVTTYVYDALIFPYITQTYATATTITVITGAFRHTPTPTAATAHRNRHKRKSGNKQAIYSIGSSQAVFGQQPAVSSHTYDASMTACDSETAPTPTTTYTTAIINIYPANQSPPSTHSLDYYYGRRYYSPELGRWPSRDPIGEKVFALYTRSLSKLTSVYEGMVAEPKDLYVAFLNDPVNHMDYRGLFAVSGNCSPFASTDLESQIQSSFNALIDNVTEPLQQAMRDNWDNMSFVCRDNSHTDCREETGPGSWITREGRSAVGVLRDINTTYTDQLPGGGTITVPLKKKKNWYAIATICPCNIGSLEGIGVASFHEAAHAVGWGGPYFDEDYPELNNLPSPLQDHPSGWGVPLTTD